MILTLVFLFNLADTGFISATTGINSGDWLSYDVINASDTINDFYGSFPPGTYFGNWSVISGDFINYNLTSVLDGVLNGTLFFGNEINNVSFFDVRNTDTAFGLGLGIYPWNGGFFANSSNWGNILSSIDGTNTTVNHMGGLNFTINEIQNTYSVIHFNTSNFYGQYSSFYYHKDSGVLLKAFVSFGLYELDISLCATSLFLEPYSEPPNTETTNMSLIVFLSSIFLLSAVVGLKKKC